MKGNCFLWTLAATLVVSPSFAQSDPAGAEVLYRAAVELMKAHNYAEACPKLEESQKLDPATGTLVKLGECYEGAGKFASAWGRYNEALLSPSVKGNPEREPKVRERIAAVEGKMSRLTIVVPAAVADVPGLLVKRDGAELGKGTWGVAMPVDAGQHVVEAVAPGKQRWAVAVEVGSQSTASVAVPTLAEAQTTQPAGSPQPPTPEVAAPTMQPSASPAAERQVAASPPSSNGQRIAAYSAFGASAVALGLGIVFEIQRSNTKSAQRNSPCDPSNASQYDASGKIIPGSRCADVRDQYDSDGKTASSANTKEIVAFIASGALAAGGVVLLVTTPSAPTTARVAPVVTAHGGGVGVWGSW